MNRNKYQIIRHEHSKNPQLTPKIPAKKATNIRKKLLGGQSAHHNNRNQHKMIPFRESQQILLSNQQIRSSAVYRMLQQQIRVMTHRHQMQLQKLRQIKNQKDKNLNNLKKSQYNTKMQIWELKNEAMELKQSIKEEKEESSRLMRELGMNEYDSDDENPST